MKRFLVGCFVLLFFGFPRISSAQEGAIKLAEWVYGIKGGRGGEGINTGLVVGDRGGVFVYSCSIEDYDERLQAIRSVAGGKPVRFVAAFCDRLDLS